MSPQNRELYECKQYSKKKKQVLDTTWSYVGFPPKQNVGGTQLYRKSCML